MTPVEFPVQSPVLPMLCSVEFLVEGPVDFSLPHDERGVPSSQPSASYTHFHSRCTCTNCRMGVITENSRHKNNLFLSELLARQLGKFGSE